MQSGRAEHVEVNDIQYSISYILYYIEFQRKNVSNGTGVGAFWYPWFAVYGRRLNWPPDACTRASNRLNRFSRSLNGRLFYGSQKYISTWSYWKTIVSRQLFYFHREKRYFTQIYTLHIYTAYACKVVTKSWVKLLFILFLLHRSI